MAALAACVYELQRPSGNWSYLGVYGLTALCFATRFFAARAIGVGLCFAAVVGHLALSGYGTRGDYCTWLALAAPLGLLLLCSRDLVERYDRAPRWFFIKNYWADLPARHVRGLLYCGYAMGALGHLLFLAWSPVSEWPGGPSWPLWSIIGIGVCLTLLGLGRAIAIPLTAALAGAVLVGVVDDVGPAMALNAGDYGGELPGSLLYLLGPDLALPTVICAGVGFAIAVCYTGAFVVASVRR